MGSWNIWFMAAGFMIVLELFSGTFYLLMIALGLGAGGIAALSGASAAWQLFAAASVGALATLGLRGSRFGKRRSFDATRDASVNLDIGQRVAVGEWADDGTGTMVARTAYRGALWDVALRHGELPRAGSFVITEVRGSRLIVSGDIPSDNAQ